MTGFNELPIELNYLSEGLVIYINSYTDNTLFFAHDAYDNCESTFQLIEGCYYEYQFNNSDYYFCKDQVVTPNLRNKHMGMIAPNTFVGVLNIPVYYKDSEIGCLELEVQSIKADYRSDYRVMLSEITQKSTELLMQANSPSAHYFETEYSNNSTTMFQKFEFIKSIISSENFSLSMQKILSMPVTRFIETKKYKDIRKSRRFTSSNIKEINSSRQRITITGSSDLESHGINSVPREIYCSELADSYDTPENRFVKYSLTEYYKFCIEVNEKSKKNSRVFKESLSIINELEAYISNDFFNKVTNLSIIPLNSTILQRKDGYRQILKYWLMFELASKIVWQAGDDIFSGGKKDVALLYEYWVFFKLLDILQDIDIFEINDENLLALIKLSSDGFSLQIKKGNKISISGNYNRLINIKLNYNRRFGGPNTHHGSGSWTIPMIPDYTLSFWPYEFSENEAETQDLISYIHFDAKYRLTDLKQIIKSKFEDCDNNECEEKSNGSFKNDDLLKMHAYKDAIKKTAGAYIIYPGKDSLILKEFHDILPSIGAFAMTPGKQDVGISELKQFIIESINNYSENI